MQYYFISRFFVKALHSMGELNFKEPFNDILPAWFVIKRIRTQKKWVYPEDVVKKILVICSRVNGKNKRVRSEKMSKSKKNIVDPVNIIKKYGADTARLFMLSDSPPERKLEWTNSGIDGSNKFLLKVWKFFDTLSLSNVLS